MLGSKILNRPDWRGLPTRPREPAKSKKKFAGGAKVARCAFCIRRSIGSDHLCGCARQCWHRWAKYWPKEFFYIRWLLREDRSNRSARLSLQICQRHQQRSEQRHVETAQFLARSIRSRNSWSIRTSGIAIRLRSRANDLSGRCSPSKLTTKLYDRAGVNSGSKLTRNN